MDILCEILHKRIPDHLLDRQTAEKMIRYSGGVLRELYSPLLRNGLLGLRLHQR